MDHGPDIRLIDPHAERRGGYHDIQLAAHEFFLHPAPPLRIEAGMVAGHAKLAPPGCGQSFGLLARRRVDNRRAVLGFEQDRPRQRGPLGWQRLHNLDADILPAKAMDEVLDRAQPKLRRDVFLHQRRRRRGKRQRRRRTESRQILAQHAVIRAKVVTPLRDAVRFIDGDQRGLSLGQHLRKAGHAQPLGSDKQKLKVALHVVDASLPRALTIAAGVDALGR